MRFETSVEIGASQQRVWEILAGIEAWPRLLETVDEAEVLTPEPVGVGSRVRLRQPKLPEGVYEITAWEAPAFFAWTQRASGASTTAGHRVDALDAGRARLTLTVELKGLLIPIMGRFYKDLTNRYLRLEAEGIKRAAESA